MSSAPQGTRAVHIDTQLPVSDEMRSKRVSHTPHGTIVFSSEPIVPLSTQGHDPDHASHHVDPFHHGGVDFGTAHHAASPFVQASPVQAPTAPAPGTGGTRLNVVQLKTSKETLLACQQIGIAKSKMPWAETLVLAFLAGGYIALAGFLSIIIGGGQNPDVSAGNVAFIKGAVFPFGLMAVVIAGADLFTGNTMMLAPGVLNRKISILSLFRNWGLVYFGNFVGSVFVAYFLCDLTNLTDGCAFTPTGSTKCTTYSTVAYKVAQAKMSIGWGAAFLRGIGCNWLVCLSLYQAVASEDVVSKIWAIWWPVMAFVAMGFEHSVANMFFVPVGLMLGYQPGYTGNEYTFGDFLWKNLIPVTLGNILGGFFFVGTLYWFLYGREKQAVPGASGPAVAKTPVVGGCAGKCAETTWGAVKSDNGGRKGGDLEMGAVGDKGSATVDSSKDR
jgi:formate/nitrite transporter